MAKRQILNTPIVDTFDGDQNRRDKYKQWSERAVVVGFNAKTQAYDIVVTTERLTGANKRTLNRTIRQVKSLTPNTEFSPGDSVLIGYEADQREHPIVLGQGDNFVQTPVKVTLPNPFIGSFFERDTPLGVAPELPGPLVGTTIKQENWEYDTSSDCRINNGSVSVEFGVHYPWSEIFAHPTPTQFTGMLCHATGFPNITPPIKDQTPESVGHIVVTVVDGSVVANSPSHFGYQTALLDYGFDQYMEVETFKDSFDPEGRPFFYLSGPSAGVTTGGFHLHGMMGFGVRLEGTPSGSPFRGYMVMWEDRIGTRLELPDDAPFTAGHWRLSLYKAFDVDMKLTQAERNGLFRVAGPIPVPEGGVRVKISAASTNLSGKSGPNGDEISSTRTEPGDSGITHVKVQFDGQTVMTFTDFLPDLLRKGQGGGFVALPIADGLQFGPFIPFSRAKFDNLCYGGLESVVGPLTATTPSHIVCNNF